MVANLFPSISPYELVPEFVYEFFDRRSEYCDAILDNLLSPFSYEQN